MPTFCVVQCSRALDGETKAMIREYATTSNRVGGADRCCAAILLAVLATAVAAAPGAIDAVTPAAPFRAPYVPTRNADVLQQVPATSDPAVRLMEDLRAKRSAEPASLPLAEQLAR